MISSLKCIAVKYKIMEEKLEQNSEMYQLYAIEGKKEYCVVEVDYKHRTIGLTRRFMLKNGLEVIQQGCGKIIDNQQKLISIFKENTEKPAESTYSKDMLSVLPLPVWRNNVKDIINKMNIIGDGDWTLEEDIEPDSESFLKDICQVEREYTVVIINYLKREIILKKRFVHMYGMDMIQEEHAVFHRGMLRSQYRGQCGETINTKYEDDLPHILSLPKYSEHKNDILNRIKLIGDGDWNTITYEQDVLFNKI